jgi:regulatory protein
MRIRLTAESVHGKSVPVPVFGFPMPTHKQTAIEYGIAVVSARPLPEKKAREKIAARFPVEETDAAIARLRELRYVDDAAWAERFVRDRFERARKGRHRIRVDLQRSGIAAETADAAIAAVIGVEDERESARQVLETLTRRLARGEGSDDSRTRGRLFRQMMSRGYSAGLVRELLDVS